MNKPVFVILISIAVSISSIAHAQTTTAFDGAYTGVSNTALGGGPACDPFAAIPRPLTVRNGEAQFSGGPHGEIVFRGHVSLQGDLKMQDNRTDTIIGGIDRTVRQPGMSLLAILAALLPPFGKSNNHSTRADSLQPLYAS